ncbi:ParB/RepB/Spo0J family partition protein [Treponema sp.]|uniref:ParB/RepB/Spo0J family partition protein n=1 Tax=Treponema sp. TaxID=166 RepID=UPI003FA1D3B7
MPKIEPTGLTQKISLSQIIETGNIREDYRDIEELAQSIKDNGLMQPIVVKRAGLSPDGIPQYELIAGNRRKRAFEYLCSKGDDFSMIDAVIKTGDKLPLQLIENIQRSDLTAAERENGVAEMLKTGITQREIAAKLAKSEQWVSKHLASHKIRTFLTQKNINTECETNILNMFRTIPENDLPALIAEMEQQGGTRTAAEKVLSAYKQNRNPLEKAEQPPPAEDYPLKEPVPPPFASESGRQTPAVHNNPAQNKTSAVPHKTPESERIIEPDKILNAKDVFCEINAYILSIKNKIESISDIEACTLQNAKIEAAYDIIALLHTKL